MTFAPYTRTLKGVVSICVTLFFITSFSFSQNYKLHPELKGEACASRSKTLACLENTLSSIDHDMGFYASLDKNGEAYYTAQYCLQIAYVYRQMGFSKKSLEYLVRAKEAYDNIDPNYESNSTATIGFILVTELDEYCSMNSASECDEWFGKQDQVAESEKVKMEAEMITPVAMEQPIAGNVESSLLRSLEKFLKQNPISYEFLKTNASDSCVIHITRNVTNSEQILDTYLEHSWHVDLVGHHLMGLAKEIANNESLKENHFDMTILVRPNDNDTVMYNDGKFYVYYERQ